MTDYDETIRPCFAYSPSGTACDMPGGHPGNHSHTQAWTDAECMTPAQMMAFLATQPAPAAAPPITHPSLPAPVSAFADEFPEGPDADIIPFPGPVLRVRDDGIPVVAAPAPPDAVREEANCVACDHPQSIHGARGCNGSGLAQDNKCGCLAFV